jgi:hypothetical protein
LNDLEVNEMESLFHTAIFIPPASFITDESKKSIRLLAEALMVVGIKKFWTKRSDFRELLEQYAEKG